MLFGEQRVGRAAVIGFVRLGMHERQGLDDRVQMGRAAPGISILLNLPAVGEQSDAIAGVHGDLREGERGVHGVVEFRQSQRRAAAHNLLAQKASGIEHDPHRLAALHLKHARDEF